MTSTTNTNTNTNIVSNSYYYYYSYYIIPIYIGYRIWLSNRMPITDCDEVYNYWEPLHYLLFNNGFQTWEYSNEYALRTYAYLIPMLGISKFYLKLIPFVPNWLWPLLSDQIHSLNTSTIATSTIINDNHNKVALFILLRATLATIMSISELSFCKSIIDINNNNNNNNLNAAKIGIVTGILLLTSAGMAHSSGALLPSSTITSLWLFATSAFLQKQHLKFTILAIIATLSVGWPFGVLMFIPLGITILLRELKKSSNNNNNNNIIKFMFQIISITVIVQCCVMLIDKQQYDDWVSPTLNIFIYNTKSGGDELYGIEPYTYYIKNLILNFNFVAIVGILSGFPLLIYYLVFIRKRNDDYSYYYGDLLIALLPMYIWIGIVFPRPHKEERFLFPIYPSMCLGSAMLSVTFIDVLVTGSWKSSNSNNKKKDDGETSSPSSPLALGNNNTMKRALFIQGIIWLPSILFSFSRTYALSKYYTAPLYVYSTFQNIIPDNVIDSTICTCGEWYRFPSSFYLPSSINKFGFVQSSFEGQLPQLFQPNIGSGKPTTKKELKNNNANHFNDQNLPEPGSYTSIDDCDYLIDLWTSTDCRENDSIWKPIAHESFLNVDMTSSTLHRALYIPYLHESEVEGGRGSVVYVDYVLYQRQEQQEEEQEQ